MQRKAGVTCKQNFIHIHFLILQPAQIQTWYWIQTMNATAQLTPIRRHYKMIQFSAEPVQRVAQQDQLLELNPLMNVVCLAKYQLPFFH